ncbi:MAG: tetratricopeptide repeat protein [Planctomycetes bacterium]|nr:tetratricopeptide repeat protein [Planctomycetota bacterium]
MDPAQKTIIVALALCLAGAVSQPATAQPVDRPAIEARLEAASAASGARREELAEQVIAQLYELVRQTAGASAPADLLEHYRARLMLGDAIGLVGSAVYADRLSYLIGDKSDAEKLRDLAEQSLTVLDDLGRDLIEQLDLANRDIKLVVVAWPQKLQTVIDAVRYDSAWVRFHLAMALGELAGRQDADDPLARRRNLLDAAMSTAAAIAENDKTTDSEKKYRSLLLAGMAASQTDAHEQAAKWLTAAALADAPKATQLQSIFELAKLAVKDQQWQRAEELAQAFMQRGLLLSDKAGQAGIELKAAFLLNYIHRLHGQAVAASDLNQAQALRSRSQQAFADVIGRYPAYSNVFAKLIGRHYLDASDLSTLPDPLVYAKALAIGLEKPDEAVRCLRELIRRGEDAARRAEQTGQFYPPALLLLARTLAGQGPWPMRAESASLYRQYAEQFYNLPNALPAACNAVAILHGRVREIFDDGLPAATALHRELVAIIRILMDRWPNTPQAQTHLYTLAMQYEALGDLDEAIRWYQSVPADSPDALPAANKSLSLHLRQLASLTGQERTERARALVAELRLFAGVARRAADAATNADAAAMPLKLGADADYRVGELLKTELHSIDEAAVHITGLALRWPERHDVIERADVFEIELLLEQGQIARATEAVQRFLASRSGKADVTLGRVAMTMRRLGCSPGPAEAGDETSQRWREVYRLFAEAANGAAASLSEPAKYHYRQMLAEAWAETGETRQAMEFFNSLHDQRPDDAGNLIGLARCHWLCRQYDQAVKLYQQVLDGLDPDKQPQLWWSCQLAQAECLYEAVVGDHEQLHRLAVRLRQLRLQNQNSGFCRPQFEQLEAKVTKTLGED